MRCALLTLLCVVTACSSAPGGGGGRPGAPPAGSPTPSPSQSPAPSAAPFEPLPPRVYVAKVKALLTGLAATDDEVAAVTADPRALAGLVDRWTATPQFDERMLRFFQQAFQQTQTDIGDYDDIIGLKTDNWQFRDELLRSLEESFARTVLALIAEHRPFTEVLTTDRFMLNPPLMVILSAMDALPEDDDGKLVRAGVWPLQRFPGLTLVRTNNADPTTGAPRPIPYAETTDPASPNFMHFFDPNRATKADCPDPQSFTGPAALTGFVELMWGRRPGACGGTTAAFTPADFAGWRMVRVRPPRAGEQRTLFWDLPRFRDPNTSELVLATPRVGFMTTLAFFANWPTNASNASRVTTNQTLIVALGRSFDDRGTTVQVSETSVDAMHVQPGTTCYGCHVTLDPMRDFFRQTYDITYFPQTAPAKIPAQATFTVDDSAPITGNGVAAFARALAGHPRFPVAWAQKLCQFANSAPCDEADPELARVVQAWRAGGLEWKVLVRELMSSPLVTFASRTRSGDVNGVSMSIARREALCATLQNRLGVPDVCGLVAPMGKVGLTAHNLAMAVPGGGYSRGQEVALLPHDPNLFFAAATENLCALIAPTLVDAGARSRWTSARAADAVRDFVQSVMGLPAGDARAPVVRQRLEEHQAAAMKAGASATDALRSTFVVACSSPFVLAQGL